jgi:hypothetical protein
MRRIALGGYRSEVCFSGTGMCRRRRLLQRRRLLRTKVGAMQALPERAAFGRHDCGVAFFGDSGEFRGVIGGVLFGGG